MLKNKTILLEDYESENAPFTKRIESNIQAVMKLRSEYQHEKYVEEFEKEFAAYNGSKYVIAVNSGTTALELALKVSGIKEGDEVILPSYTYISTALAVSNLRAIPVFVDIRQDTLTIDPKRIEDRLTKKTKAIIPVHIHGNPCDLDRISKIAKGNKLALVEDCSHAHGAEYHNKKVGNFGIGCFSCHTSKIFSGIGNSGLMTINNKKIYAAVKEMTAVQNDPALVLSKRTPCGMDAIQAAILKAKLPYLDKILERKRSVACRYIKALPDNMGYQREEKLSKHVYRDFVILTENRDKLSACFLKTGIEAKIRYSSPLHLTRYYKSLPSDKKDFRITNKIFNELLWIPDSHLLPDKKILCICDILRNHNASIKKK